MLFMQLNHCVITMLPGVLLLMSVFWIYQKHLI